MTRPLSMRNDSGRPRGHRGIHRRRKHSLGIAPEQVDAGPVDEVDGAGRADHEGRPSQCVQHDLQRGGAPAAVSRSPEGLRANGSEPGEKTRSTAHEDTHLVVPGQADCLIHWEADLRVHPGRNGIVEHHAIAPRRGNVVGLPRPRFFQGTREARGFMM
jgi:hypothetical protein